MGLDVHWVMVGLGSTKGCGSICSQPGGCCRGRSAAVGQTVPPAAAGQADAVKCIRNKEFCLFLLEKSFSSERDGYLNGRLYGALTEMSPGGVCSLLLNEKGTQILFFAQLTVTWRFPLGMPHRISGIEAALERFGCSLQSSI